MRKKFQVTAILWLCMVLVAHAGPVSMEQAKAIASQCGKRIDGTRRAPQTGEVTLAQVRMSDTELAEGGVPLYYVFNRPEGNGFVIVAGDDRMRPVIAETDSGKFDAETVNPGLKWWLDAVAQSAERLADIADESPRYVRRSAAASAVEPLIQTQWGQNAPFNNQCPELNGTHCVTGCVATAMAQMFYFLGYPSTGKGEVSYSYTINFSDGTSKLMELSGDLSSFSFDYSKMKLTYDEDETSEAADEVAELMYACGLASNMLYTTSSSGSSIKYKVLTENFGLDATCAWASRADYSTEEWENLLLGELQAGRPVFYSGSDTDGNGHQFLCDGYDGDGRFHINWGWAGYQDGYFDLAAIEYCEGQDMVYNVKANEGGTADVLSYFTVDSVELSTYSDKAFSHLSLPYSANIGSYVYVGVRGLACQWIGADLYGGVALYNGDEPSNSCMSSKSCIANSSYSFWFGYSLPSTLAEGVYTLRPVVGLSTDDYEQVKGASSSDGPKYLIVAVQDGKAIFTDCMKTIPASGYATFSAFCNVKLPEGLAAYKAKLNSDNTKVVLTKIKGDVIPANTGVVLYYENGGKFLLDITDETATDAFTDNALIATTTQPTVPAEGTYYALKANSNVFAQLQNELTLSVGKAYLKTNEASTSKALTLTFDEDEADAIGVIHSAERMDDGAYYTLQGVRVAHPSRGIYIHNGKKILVK